MKIIQKLNAVVERNCTSQAESPNSLTYWSNVIFAKSVFALTPLSLLAYIPAVIICVQTKSYLILGVDTFCIGMLIILGYAPGIPVNTRKTILMFLVFLVSFILLKEFGGFGPGLVYLLSSTVFMLLFFPDKNPKIPFILTVTFCLIYGFFLYFNLFIPYPDRYVSVLAWIAVSSNVIFLSALLTLLIPFFFSKLASMLAEKQLLLEDLHATNMRLEKSIELVKNKNAQLEEYAFVASHDLQEQLRMISSFQTKLVKKYEGQLDQKAHQYISFATEGAHRMKKIIQELLDHSSAGRDTLINEEIDLNKILVEYTVSRNALITEKSVRIEAGKLPPIKGSEAQLIQTLHCLLDNAITYSRPGVTPRILITVADQSEKWLFAIQDNGIGIESQFFDKIFVIFQRLHNRDQYSGTGLGLSIVKKNVESWGGKIWLESTPGVGSTFYFTLPKPPKS